jgi:hypothetical protein
MPISRRVLLGAAMTLAAMEGRSPPAAADEPIKEADKIKQTDAKYQKEPKGQQRCEICLQFQPPSSCKIVQGPITPQGWCQFFAAKENAH